MGAAALASLTEQVPPRAVVAAEPPWGERPLAATAEARGLEVRHLHRIGPRPAEDQPDLFADLDVAVCCCWTELLRPGALRGPAHGWLNLHPSALPAWRGADPVGWQLLTSPERMGCSVHRMTTGQDDGPVVAEGWVVVLTGDDRGALLRRSGEELGRLAAGVLADLSRGDPLPERAQDPDEATWCPPPGTGVTVDPRRMRAEAGARVARAFSPHPGVAVATMRAGERFALAEVGRELAAGEIPGSVADDQAAAAGVADDRSPGARAGGLRSQTRPLGEGEAVAVAFRDRWLHGRVRTLGEPADFDTGASRAGGARDHGAVHLPLDEPGRAPE